MGMTNVTRLIQFVAASIALVLSSGCGRDDRRDDNAEPSTNATAGLTARSELLGEPQREKARISPDGKRIAWIMNTREGSALYIALVTAIDKGAIVATSDALGDFASIDDYKWAGNNTHIIVSTSARSMAESAIFSVNIFTRDVKALFDEDDSQAFVAGASLDYPDEIVIAANDRDPSAFDLHRVNVVNANHRRIFRNTSGFVEFGVDADLQVRLAYKPVEDGGAIAFVRDAQPDAPWRELAKWEPEDALASGPIGFDGTGRNIYALDTRDLDTRAIVRINVETGDREILGSVAGADVDNVLLHPATNALDGFSVERLRREWIAYSPNGAQALARIEEFVGPNFRITGRSLDDRVWTIVTEDAKRRHYLFDREKNEPKLLFAARELPAIDTRRTPVVIPTSDGLDLVSYLNLPTSADANGDGSPDTALPLVIVLHSGPWDRAHAAFSPFDALLADRGYAVLALNTRGSRGFGKAFLNAGAGAWGGDVLIDIAAAANWAVEKGVADPERVGLIGQYFGGHAVLSAIARNPETYACAVSYNTVADLLATVENPPPRYRPFAPLLERMIGDVNDPETRGVLAARSLGAIAGNIRKPALIIQGYPDPLEQGVMATDLALAAAKNGADLNVLVVDASEEQGGEERSELAMFAGIEHFLAQCLGGRAEPFGDDITLAPVRVVNDSGELTDLAKALDNRG